MLIGVLLLAFLLAIIFCIGLVHMKRKNDKISTKIQMLTDLKRDSMPHTNRDTGPQPSSMPVIDDEVLEQVKNVNSLT